MSSFAAAPDAHTQLAGLKEMTSSYKRGKFVEDGGWAMIVPANCSAEPASPVSSSDHREAAGLCAEELAKREIPASGNAAQINDEATTAQ